MHRLIACLNVACLAGVCAVIARASDCAELAVSDDARIFPVSTTQCSKGAAVAAANARERRRRARPQRPTQSAPVSDGSQGRSPDAPSLTPDYMAKWEVIRKSRMAGSYEYDNNAKCLPPGMPAMMSMAYGMEVMQTKDKITFFSELNDALRRVYLDGRKPTQKHPGRSRRMRDTRPATGKATRSSSKRSRCTLIRSSRASLPIATRWRSGSVFAWSVQDCSKTALP